jgi:hypothetical protein
MMSAGTYHLRRGRLRRCAHTHTQHQREIDSEIFFLEEKNLIDELVIHQ